MFSSIVTTSSSAISLLTAIGLGIGSAIVAGFLILLLSVKEVSIPTKYYNEIKRNLNAAIAPLLVVFTLTVIFKIITLGIL